MQVKKMKKSLVMRVCKVYNWIHGMTEISISAFAQFKHAQNNQIDLVRKGLKLNSTFRPPNSLFSSQFFIRVEQNWTSYF